MDECLIHTFRSKEMEKLCLIGRYDKTQILKFVVDGHGKKTCVKRPGVEQFLLDMSKHFILIPWTAGTQEYATPILDWLDPTGSLFKYRFFRQHCTRISYDGAVSYVKDLQVLNLPLSRVIILDNNPHSYQNQPGNGVPIINFEGDQWDRELRYGDYTELLVQASKFANVKKAINADFRLIVEKQRDEVVTRQTAGQRKFDFSNYIRREVSPPTPIRKRRSVDYEGTVTVRGRTPKPAGTRTSEYSPRKRSRVPIPFRLNTYAFEMPPACRVVGNTLIFPSESDVEAGDIIMEEPTALEVEDKLVRCRFAMRDRRRVRSRISRKSQCK